MKRIILSVILSAVAVGMGMLSDGFGDMNCTPETWICSFILPIWSILTISLWHDVGRFIWSKTFDLDSEESTVSYDVRSFVFIVWMSIVATYVVWVHISLVAIPMILVIPVLGYYLQDYLAHDWSVTPTVTVKDLTPVISWAVISYYVFWLLTIGWILLRVWAVDTFDNGVVYFIQ